MATTYQLGDTRLTVYATEDVAVERLQPDGRWLLRGKPSLPSASKRQQSLTLA